MCGFVCFVCLLLIFLKFVFVTVAVVVVVAAVWVGNARRTFDVFLWVFCIVARCVATVYIRVYIEN